MLANTTGIYTGYLAGKYPGKIGHLFSPGAQTRHPFHFMPFALDNGRFTKRGEDWDLLEWHRLLSWSVCEHHFPLWVAVPDVVEDADATLAEWEKYAPQLIKLGHTLAFVAQDGHTAADVPEEASVVFVGGSYAWKWGTLQMWCKNFPRVHVGRVNSPRRLYECEALGVESVDGTGWFRAGSDPSKNPQLAGLETYLEASQRGNMRVYIQQDIFEPNAKEEEE